VESMYEAMALAILGGAGGGVGQTAVSAWIERLRRRHAGDPGMAGLSLESGPDDEEAIRAISTAIQQEALGDPAALTELQRWWHQNPAGGIHSCNGQITAGNGRVTVHGNQTFNFGPAARES